MTPAGVVGLALAGAAGAVARYLLDGFVRDHADSRFPWGTLVINVSGSLMLGVITGAVLYHAFPSTPALWLGSGFCGAYTTFSTFAYETVRLLEEGAVAGACANAVASLLAGTAAAAAGLVVAAVF